MIGAALAIGVALIFAGWLVERYSAGRPVESVRRAVRQEIERDNMRRLRRSLLCARTTHGAEREEVIVR